MKNVIQIVGVGSLFAAALVSPQLLDAQDSPARAAADCFEQVVEARREGRDTLCPDGVLHPLDIFLHPSSHSDSLVEGMLDEFARLAVESDDEVVQTESIGWLRVAGCCWTPELSERHGGIVERLARVYGRAAELDEDSAHLVRMSVVGSLGWQRDAKEAAKLLERIAAECPNPRWTESPSGRAVEALRQLGPPGEPALERIEARTRSPSYSDSLHKACDIPPNQIWL